MSRTGCELKCYEQYGNWRPLNTGHWECMNDMVMGLTWRDRIGSQVRIKQVSVRADIAWPNSVASRNVLRTMVFLDRQCGGVTPTLAEMWWTPGSSTLLQSASPIYWLYRDRFIPMYDKSWSSSMSYGGAAVGADPFQFLDFTVDCDIVTNFKSNTGTVADIVGNALFLYAYTSDSAVGSNTPYFNWWTRVLYTDC